MVSYGADGHSPYRAAGAQPEILPPTNADEETRRRYAYVRMEPEPPPPRRRNRWSYAPATYVLVGINCLVFIGMMLNGVSIISPTPTELLNWQANNGYLVLRDSQWW